MTKLKLGSDRYESPQEKLWTQQGILPEKTIS